MDPTVNSNVIMLCRAICTVADNATMRVDSRQNVTPSRVDTVLDDAFFESAIGSAEQAIPQGKALERRPFR